MVLLIGAVGSIIFMFNAGRNQKSILLIALFTAWVLSPFIALLGINIISNRWAVTTRVALYGLMLILSAGSLASYGEAFSLPGTRPAFKFLIVPLLSWVLMVTAIPILRYLENRNKEK